MKKFFEEIGNASKGEYGAGVLYAGAVGLILSDVIPTPADALYYYTEKKLREKWKNGEITPEKYWEKTAMAYYLYKPIWWILVVAVVYNIPGDLTKKAKVGMSIVGAGALIGIISRNYSQDIKQIRQEVLDTQEPKEEFAGGKNTNIVNHFRSGQFRQVMRRGQYIKFV
jgi:hypothetical protein